MNKAVRNIHYLFWGCIPIFLLYGFMSKYDIDINIHDTMFVIGVKYISLFFTLIFFIIGLGYCLSYKSDKFKPVNVLTILHVLLTFIGLGLLFFVPEYRYEVPVENVEDMTHNNKMADLYERILLFGGLSVLIAQPILLLNLTLSIFRK